MKTKPANLGRQKKTCPKHGDSPRGGLGYRCLICEPLKKPGCPRKDYGVNFDTLDWNKRDCLLTKETGVPHSAINLERKRRGIPRGTVGHMWQTEEGKAMLRVVPLEKYDFDKSDVWNSRVLGISRERVRQVRKKLGLASSKTIAKGSAFWCDSADWSKRNTDLAKEYNVSKCYVSYLRNKLGKPKAPSNIKYKVDWTKVDWSRRNIDLAKEFKMPTILVSTYRQRLARDTVRILRRKKRRSK